MNGGPHPWIVGIAVLSLLGSAAVGLGSGAAEGPDGSEVPKSEAARKNPQPASPQNLAQGKAYFESQCAMCHGVEGTGRGDLAVSLQMNVPDFTDAKLQRTRTDGELFYVVVNGRGDMPGEGESRLPESVRWNMILHIRSMAGEG